MTFLDQKEVDVDVYISTWNQTNTLNPQRIGSVGEKNYTPVYRPVTKEEIQQVIPNCNITIQDSAIIADGRKDWKKMVTGWVLGLETVKQSLVNYDYMLLLRPDLFFNESAQFDVDKFKNFQDSIGIHTGEDITHVDDTCFFGSFENMQKIIDPQLLSNIYDEKLTIHQILSNHIRNENNLNICPIPITASFVIARYPTTLDEDFTSVQTRFFKWFHDGKYDF